MKRRYNSDDGQGTDLFFLLWGDVVSLLLVFFVILFSYSNINLAESNFQGKVKALAEQLKYKDKIEKAEKQNVADLTVEEKRLLNDFQTFKSLINKLNISINYFTELAGESNPADVEEFKQIVTELQASVTKLEEKKDISNRKDLFFAIQEPKLIDYIQNAYETEKSLIELEKQLKEMNLDKSYDLKIEKDKIRFDLLDHAFFAYQSTKLTKESKKLLGEVAQVLSEIPGVIEVEGHTDNIPMKENAKIPSNWEFSAYRAASVIRFLEEWGLPSERFVLVGYSEHRPLATNKTVEGRRKNRRISLTLER